MNIRVVIGLAALLSGCTHSGGTTSVPVARATAAPAPANPPESTFVATVTQVGMGNVRHPNLRWVVVLKIDKLVSGPTVGDEFWFAIHSPSQEGIEVGQRYLIVAEKHDDGYRVASRDRLD